jgi:hypothetical protein
VSHLAVDGIERLKNRVLPLPAACVGVLLFTLALVFSSTDTCGMSGQELYPLPTQNFDIGSWPQKQDGEGAEERRREAQGNM